MLDVIAKICSMPRDFYTYGNSKSIIQLFEETGYFEQPEIATKEKLLEHLMAYPDLINDWENYSSNKHYSPSWYFLKNKSEWIVGYTSIPSQEQKQTYTSGFEACAEFILHELNIFYKKRIRH